MADGESHNEVKRRLSRRFQVSMVGEGLLVGVAAGGVVTFYRFALANAEKALRAITSIATGKPLYMLAWFAVLALILLIVGRLVSWEPATSGSGIPQIDAEVIDRMDAPWHRVIVAKFCEGTLLAFAGLSLGREGPSVQLGGMAGKGVSRLLKRERGEERLLVTCGAAAGMSAAFHAPLTGVLFALEEIHKEFTAPLIISVMCSCVASDYLASVVLGVEPVLSFVLSWELPRSYYALVVLFGLVCGVLGAAHNAGMFAIQGLFGRIQRGVPYSRYVVPFALAGVGAFAWSQLLCGGDALVEEVDAISYLAGASGRDYIWQLLILLVTKYLFTAICFGSGAPGGTLFPLVVMGTLAGGLFAGAAEAVMDSYSIYAYFPNFVVLGIAGLFAGAVRAPVTAVVLVFELTGSLDALLSASIVSILAYVTANLMRVDGFYEHLLAGFLGDEDVAVAEKGLQTVLIGAGCRLEGLKISEIPWPDGVRVLTIERAGGHIVPTGDTELMALDELLLMVPEGTSDDAMLKLKLMCGQSLAG